MGVIGFLGKKSIQAAVVFVVIAFVPGLPPHNMEFTAYSVKPTLPLEGKLSVNNKLDNAERLFENELKGPEGLAVYKNELYTGIHGGHIVKIKNNKIVPVIKFGEACQGLFEEEKCGRVLGIRFDKRGILYAVDAYYGIFKVNMTTGEIETIVKKDEIIEGKPVKLPNSIDFGRDGSLYWSISSTSHELFDGMYTLLGDGNGRLIKTNPKTKTHEVLIDNLHFANGVVLSQDESFVLVAETARARIMRYHLKGPNKGKVDVFIEGLPGLPDNLQRDPKTGEFLIPLIKPIEKNYPHLPFTLSPYPILRKFIVRVATLIELSIKFFNDLYPSVYFKRALHFVGHFESINLVPGKRVTIIRANENGEIVSSLHSTDGKISDICDIEYFNGAYYLASPFNPYLARVTAS